jgi:hypothetical protein
VTINRIEGIQGANARLEALGINVRAVPFVASCASLRAATGAPAPAALRRALRFARARSGAIMSVRIAPWRIDHDKVAVLAPRPGQVTPGALVGEIKHGAIPQCVGTMPAPAAPATGSVVCHTVDGKTVPLPQEFPPPGASGNSGASGTSGNSGASGDSGNVGGPGTARHRAIFCQARVGHPGTSGDSGNSGASGVTGNS